MRGVGKGIRIFALRGLYTHHISACSLPMSTPVVDASSTHSASTWRGYTHCNIAYSPLCMLSSACCCSTQLIMKFLTLVIKLFVRAPAINLGFLWIALDYKVTEDCGTRLICYR
ncbi:hypothetical protein POM88_039049 [Heracleum sosnowskyi]|uniref:Uncharacterized protein n=1 Tax=Heracleum sosnowskyi TaxID=360622 RepID=A0AAD8HBK2_9APIA|nr:hypothetical protein POM88_039049 [Heracleum sosnowskyi]